MPRIRARSRTRSSRLEARFALYWRSLGGPPLAPEFRFDQERKWRADFAHVESRTLIEIETEDRLGLLFVISQTFAELALDISAARIVTERGAAVDSFYVRELDGGKINLPLRQAKVESVLRAAIGQLEALA